MAVAYSRTTHLVHLIDSHGQLGDPERAHQQAVLPCLAARFKASLELPTAGVHHQKRHIRLQQKGTEGPATRVAGEPRSGKGDFETDGEVI